MHEAVRTNCLPMVEWLVKHGASINVRTHQKARTPLMQAAENNNCPIVLYLLRQGQLVSLG